MAGQGAIESLSVIGFSVPETTPGTFVTPTKYVPGKCTIPTQSKISRPAQSRGSRSQVIDAVVGDETGMTISGELIPEVMSSLFAYWMGVGSDVVTGSSGAGYTHALTPKNYVPYFSGEYDVDISSQLLARQIAGNKVDQIALKTTNQSLATAEFQCLGLHEQTPVTPGMPSNPTPSITALQPMDFSLMVATLDGSANTQLMDATLTLMNHCQRVYAANGSLHPTRIAETLRELSLSTTFDFLDTTLYNRFIQHQKTSAGGLVLTMTSTGNITGATNPYVVSATLPGLRANGQFPMSAANDVITQPLTWSVTEQGANECSMSIVNGESGTLA